MKRPYDLTSMTALTCFEAAARHVSFKAAAQELNVTPAAVSHQIKLLEAELGVALFQRLHRGVGLTEKGAFLLLAVQRGFEGISTAVTQLRDRRDRVDVTIRTTTAVSALWLTPKLSAFWRVHPRITVAQVVTDQPERAGHHDIGISYGLPAEDGREWHMLFHDRIIAAGTRRFATEHGIHQLSDLAQAPLIQLHNEDNDWTDWAAWFRELGQDRSRPPSLFVNNYTIALQTAQEHVGAVLGWDGLIGELLTEGRLVRLVPESVRSPVAFYLALSPRASPGARLFADWLRGHASTLSGRPAGRTGW